MDPGSENSHKMPVTGMKKSKLIFSQDELWLRNLYVQWLFQGCLDAEEQSNISNEKNKAGMTRSFFFFHLFTFPFPNYQFANG